MNRYEQVKVIGRGASGRAVLCRRKEDSLLVVVKQVELEGLSDREREEAANEVRVISLLDHPYVIRHLESFISPDDQRLHIVMEYADGGDLRSLIERRDALRPPRHFSEERVTRWLFQISHALSYLHSKKVLHRDVKTANVFLTADLKTAKLGDFGISKIMSTETRFAKTAIGTPYYLSPEIVDDKPYDEGSDIWALGCVAYEMASFRRAFEGKSLPALVVKIMRSDVAPLSRAYSSGFRQLVGSMLNRDPRLRPSAARLCTLLSVSPALKLSPPANLRLAVVAASAEGWSYPKTPTPSDSGRMLPSRAASCPSTPRCTSPVGERRASGILGSEEGFVVNEVPVDRSKDAANSPDVLSRKLYALSAPKPRSCSVSSLTPPCCRVDRPTSSSSRGVASILLENVRAASPLGRERRHSVSDSSSDIVSSLVTPRSVQRQAQPPAAQGKGQQQSALPLAVQSVPQTARPANSPLVSQPVSARDERRRKGPSPPPPPHRHSEGRASMRSSAEQARKRAIERREQSKDHEAQFRQRLRGVRPKVSLSTPAFGGRRFSPSPVPTLPSEPVSTSAPSYKPRRRSAFSAVYDDSIDPSSFVVHTPVSQEHSDYESEEAAVARPSSAHPQTEPHPPDRTNSSYSVRTSRSSSPTAGSRAARPATEEHLSRALENLRRVDEMMTYFSGARVPQEAATAAAVRSSVPAPLSAEGAEELRERLEKELGVEEFLSAYQEAANCQQGEEDPGSCAGLRQRLGDETFSLLVRLVSYDSFDDTDL